MNAPTFLLPACPRCSNRVARDRPIWRYARRTSRARGRECYVFTGCEHAVEIGKRAIRESPEEWALVEDAWGLRAKAIFAEMTARWTQHERDAYAAALLEKFSLPAAAPKR